MVDLAALPPDIQSSIQRLEPESGGATAVAELFEWQKNYIARCKENFGDTKQKLVIDCGTGTGYMALAFLQEGARVIACDLSIERLILLQKAIEGLPGAHNMFFVCCPAEALPFKNDIADFFVINAVLEHVPKEEEAIQEINRVCNSTGGLMITVPLAYRLLNPIFLIPSYLYDKKIGHLRRYSEDSLVRKLKKWHLVRTYYTGHFLKSMAIIINMVKKVFDDKEMEGMDKKKLNKKWGAGNISCFFRK